MRSANLERFLNGQRFMNGGSTYYEIYTHTYYTHGESTIGTTIMYYMAYTYYMPYCTTNSKYLTISYI